MTVRFQLDAYSTRESSFQRFARWVAIASSICCDLFRGRLRKVKYRLPVSSADAQAVAAQALDHISTPEWYAVPSVRELSAEVLDQLIATYENARWALRVVAFNLATRQRIRLISSDHLVELVNPNGVAVQLQRTTNTACTITAADRIAEMLTRLRLIQHFFSLHEVVPRELQTSDVFHYEESQWIYQLVDVLIKRLRASGYYVEVLKQGRFEYWRISEV